MKKLLVIAGNFKVKTENAYQKDLYNAIECLKRDFEIFLFALSEEDPDRIQELADQRTSGISKCTVFSRQTLGSLKALLLRPVPRAMKELFSYEYRHIISLVRSLNPDKILISPFAPMAVFAAVFAGPKVICYTGDSPSRVMALAAKESENCSQCIKQWLSSKFYKVIERWCLYRGCRMVVVTGEMKNYYKDQSMRASLISVCEPAFKVERKLSKILRMDNSHDVLFLRPNSTGKEMVFQALMLLERDKGIMKNLRVVGGDFSEDELSLFDEYGVRYQKFIDDLDDAISTAVAVVLTDVGGTGVGGIGFSNRAGQCLANGAYILSTVGGMRGTRAAPGKHFVGIVSSSDLASELRKLNRKDPRYKAIRERAGALGDQYQIKYLRERWRSILGLTSLKRCEL